MTVLNSQEFAIFKTPRFFEFGQLFIANVHDFVIILQNTFLNSRLKKMDFSILLAKNLGYVLWNKMTFVTTHVCCAVALNCTFCELILMEQKHLLWKCSCIEYIFSWKLESRWDLKLLHKMTHPFRHNKITVLAAFDWKFLKIGTLLRAKDLRKKVSNFLGEDQSLPRPHPL